MESHLQYGAHRVQRPRRILSRSTPRRSRRETGTPSRAIAWRLSPKISMPVLGALRLSQQCNRQFCLARVFKLL
jgi:hypothetical protein